MESSCKIYTRIENFDEVDEIVNKFKNSIMMQPKFLFRGQANSSWSLKPSFTRLATEKKLTRIKALKLEQEALNKFSISARNLLPIENTIGLLGAKLELLGWASMMQHYSAPTRILDWTKLLWVALYFSCCDEADSDGAVWISDFNIVTEFGIQTMKKIKTDIDLKDLFSTYLTDENAPDILQFITAINTNERIESQQGMFSVCTNPLVDHENILNSINALFKIEISKHLKPEIMKSIYQMNISAKTLFPGIDGLGKSISEYCRLWDERGIII